MDGIGTVTYNCAIMPRSATAAVSGAASAAGVEIAAPRRRLHVLPGGSHRSPAEPGSGADPGPLTTASKQPLRILIVEDDAAVATLLEDMVTGAGGESVGIITSALAAIGAAAVISPDVVLMDVRLPGAMDGIEAAGIIRARGSAAAVVIITGAVADSDIHARLRGQDRFEVVFKPVRENELCEAIRRAYAAR
jgi:CheY-like chemotaxis protein